MALPEKDLDRLDREIILDLQQNARRPYKSIAERLDVAESTVANRVNRLLKKGILKLEARIDPFCLPSRVAAIIGINLENRNHYEVMAEIEKIPGVNAAWIATGKYDIFIEVLADSIERLNDFMFEAGIGNIPHVQSTETFVVLYSKSKFFKLV